MANQKKYPAINIGSASMLVIFITLSLAVFAVLAVAGARSDLSYSERIAERTQDYYEACNEAEKILGQVDAILYEAYTNHKNMQETAELLKAEAPQGVLVEEEESLGELTDRLQEEKAGDTSELLQEKAETKLIISYSVPINENQKLCVRLAAELHPGEGEALYKILQWQELSTEEWNGDEAYNLMQE